MTTGKDNGNCSSEAPTACRCGSSPVTAQRTDSEGKVHHLCFSCASVWGSAQRTGDVQPRAIDPAENDGDQFSLGWNACLSKLRSEAASPETLTVDGAVYSADDVRRLFEDLRRYARLAAPRSAEDQAEQESPNFTPCDLKEFEARGWTRINNPRRERALPSEEPK